MSRSNLADKGRRFVDMHKEAREGGLPIVLPNVWDAGTAKIVAGEGYKALATTSAGIAFAQGLPDGEMISADAMLDACARIAAAVDLPVTADLEAGYGKSPADVAHTIRRAIDMGIVGANIEDSMAEKNYALHDFDYAIARLKAARHAAEATGVPFALNGRTDAYWGKKPDDAAAFAEAVKRGNAYLKAGATSAFVPFIGDAGVIERLVKAIDGPINVIAGPGMVSIKELARIGVARISTGGTLTRMALGMVRQAARELLTTGTYEFAKPAIGHMELNKYFKP